MVKSLTKVTIPQKKMDKWNKVRIAYVGQGFYKDVMDGTGIDRSTLYRIFVNQRAEPSEIAKIDSVIHKM